VGGGEREEKEKEEVQREPGSMKAQDGISLTLFLGESRAHVLRAGG